MKQRKHPSPFSYQIRPGRDDKCVGWFDVIFKKEPNHWYTFVLRTDGKIYPNIFDEDEVGELELLIFVKFCADPDLLYVKFTQAKPYMLEGHEWPRPPEKLHDKS